MGVFIFMTLGKYHNPMGPHADVERPGNGMKTRRLIGFSDCMCYFNTSVATTLRDCLSLPTATMRTALADRAHLLSFVSLLFFILFHVSTVVADSFKTVPVTWSATPFNGRSIPLHVKGPCNNVWQSQGNHTAPANLVWPRLWDFSHDVRIPL